MNPIDLKGKYYRVLDKGFVSLVDFMGGDDAVEQMARTSYGKGTRKTSETRGLIRYLVRNKHSTPLEGCELKFHIQIPMDAWRQMIRHRTANVNEYSTRYSIALDDTQQTPPEEWRLQSTDNKQGSSGFLEEWPDGYRVEEDYKAKYGVVKFAVLRDNELVCGFQHLPTPGKYLSHLENVQQTYDRDLYEERIRFGIAREQARKDLPLSTYTMAYWKIDLHNLFHFLKLRLDLHAQKEIREYAYAIACLTKEVAPLCWEAFEDYILYGKNFTYQDLQMLSYVLTDYNRLNHSESPEVNKELADQANKLGMSNREVGEFWAKLGKINRQEFSVNNLKEFTPDG